MRDELVQYPPGNRDGWQTFIQLDARSAHQMNLPALPRRLAPTTHDAFDDIDNGTDNGIDNIIDDIDNIEVGRRMPSTTSGSLGLPGHGFEPEACPRGHRKARV